MSGLYLMEVEAKPLEDSNGAPQFRVAQEIRTAVKGSKTQILWVFKVIGEDKFIAVVDGAVDPVVSELRKKVQSDPKIRCTPLRTFEQFASNVLRVDPSIAGPSPHMLEYGNLYWLDIQVNHQGVKTDELIDIWRRDAANLLESRSIGKLHMEMFKVVAERRVHGFFKAPNAEVMDDRVWTFPIIKKLGGQVHITTKAVTRI